MESQKKSVLNNRGLGISFKKYLYEGVIVPTVLSGPEAWGMSSSSRRTDRWVHFQQNAGL